MSKALQYLEKLSQEQPAEAIRRAETMVLEVENRLVPKVLAICGTAYRRLERHDDAMHVLLDAEELAEDLPTLADIKRRIAYAIGAQGNFKRAIEEIHKAQNLFLLAGDLPGVGRAMIDQGMQLFHQEELELAGQYLERSLDYIEPDDSLHRFSALVGMGLCSAKSDFATAESYFRQAAFEANRVGRAFQLKLSWARAQVLEAHGRRADARVVFATLAEEYLEKELYLDASLAAVDLIRCTQGLEENPDIHAALVQRIAFSLPETGWAAASVTMLWAACIRGRVQQELLDNVKEAVRKERLHLLPSP